MKDKQRFACLGIAHASLLVADTTRAVAFYRDVLGLKTTMRPDLGFPGAWLEIGDKQIHLLELPNPDPTTGRPAHGGLDRHLALYVDDLEAARATFERAGIPFTASRSGRAAIFCRDPDGNAIELLELRSP